MKILLLDDYAQPRTDARRALEQILADEAPEFFEFDNPRTALKYVSNADYDLVVTDILMPEMNGFEFSVRALKNRVVPVVMHTGTWSKEYVTQIILNGIGERLPIEIVGKRYFHESEEEYVSELKRGIENSRKRAGRLKPNLFESCIDMICKGINYAAGSELFHNNRLGIEIKDIEKINEKLRAKDDFLVDYIKAVFKELVTTLNTTAGLLQDDKLDGRNHELKKRILGIEWTSDEKSKTTSDYMHHFSGYPLPSLGMILERYGRKRDGRAEKETSQNTERESKAVVDNENEVLRKIRDIYEKMRAIEQIINDQRYMIVVNPQEKRIYQRRLETRARTPLPKPELPVKLVNRIKMLEYYFKGFRSNTPNWLVIPPQAEPREHEEDIREMLKIYRGKLIARSMFRGEDSAVPMAGFFDSVVFNSVESYYDAVKEIRAMNSRHLTQFCLHRGFQMPSREDMFIGIELYHETPYLGSVVEHPNFSGVYLIEFGERRLWGNSNLDFGSNWIKSIHILYDANNDQTLGIRKPLLDNHFSDFLGISREIVRVYKNLTKSLTGVSAEDASSTQQMEFGFDIGEGDYWIESYQLRNFRQKTPPKEVSVSDSQSVSSLQPCSQSELSDSSSGHLNPQGHSGSQKHLQKVVSLMGATEQEGIDCVVINTNDPLELGVLAEKARAQGYGIMYVSQPREEIGKGGSERFKKYDDVAIASLIPNIDVLVLGKSLGVMSHMYFNAMVNAKNVVLLEEAQLKEVPEQGSIVNYTCNGTDCSIRKIDTSERIKYQIRDVLNR